MREMHSDDHKLFSLQVGALFLLIVLILGVVLIQQRILQVPQMAAVISSVLVSLANEDRTENELGRLAVNEKLVAAAQAKANDMAQKGYFSHSSPEGYDSWHWFQKADYSFSYAGENLAVDFSDSAAVENAWMNSPTHRENILNSNFTEIGIAVAQGTYQGRNTTFVVQMFGTPAPERTVTQAQVVQTIVESNSPEEPVVVTTIDEVPDTGSGEVLSSISQNEDNAAQVQGEAYTAAPVWGFLATSPQTLLRYAYYVLGAIIVLLLIARTGIEIQRRHVGHVVIALGLIFFMVLILLVADVFLFTEPFLAPSFRA